MNSKKILIAIISVVSLLGLVVAVVLLTGSKEVEKFSNIKIVDAFGTEVSNYGENKMPFTIENASEETKVTVNGEEYQAGKRFYKPGEYVINVSDGATKEKSVVKINEIQRSEDSEYSIYITTETIQTLFANLHMANNSQEKGYLWTARTKTVNIENVRNSMPNLQLSAYNGDIEETEFEKLVLPELKEYIKNVLQQDENAYFHLYTEEDRFYLDLELFGKIGLHDNRYEVTMYTDGTLGYVRQYEITMANKYERFTEEKNTYFETVDSIKDDTGEFNDHPGSFMVDKKSVLFNVDYNYDYMLISTLRENIDYMLQYPEMIKFEDEQIAKEMENASFVKIVAREEYEKLDENERQIFFKNINLNKEELDASYFAEEDANYLVITGTKPFYGPVGKENFERIINQVCQEYQNEYTILYKPHPSGLPDEAQTAFLSSLNIKVLPGSIPMEAISFIYPNLKLGGFGSSLYMSADEGKTEFFFVKDKAELVDPLDKLYDQLFTNAKFIY